MSPVQPLQPLGQPMMGGQTVAGGPRQYYTAEQVAQMMAPKKDVGGIIKTIIIIVLILIAITFIGLFIWMFGQYTEARDDVDGQIARAVAAAKDETTAKMEADFLESEKKPYRLFSGPVDYGELSFEYPKTWSLYIAASAVRGGDYEAYFNPIQVDAVSNETVFALRLKIRNQSFEAVTSSYQDSVKSGKLEVKTVMVNDTSANYYTGLIPGTEFNGIIVVIKIRDKSAILQTDSMLFEEDFNRLLETVAFNA